MYTTKTPIDKSRFIVTQLKEFFTFSVKDRYQLNYLYINADNYFLKIKFVLFLYLLLSASWKEKTCLDIFLLSDRQWGTEYQYLRSRFLGVSMLQLLHLRLWYVDVVTVIAYTSEVVCLPFQTSRHEKYGTCSELTWFELFRIISIKA